MERQPPVPTAAAVAEAKRKPGGWVYVIREGVDPSGAVPPDAILGAWKVDVNGNLTDQFTWNPNYRPG